MLYLLHTTYKGVLQMQESDTLARAKDLSRVGRYKFNKKLGFFSNTVSSFEQFVLAKFMEKGFFEKHIIKMKNYYRSLRNNLIYCLEKSSLSSFCKIKEEEAGLHFLLEIDNIRNTCLNSLILR